MRAGSQLGTGVRQLLQRFFVSLDILLLKEFWSIQCKSQKIVPPHQALRDGPSYTLCTCRAWVKYSTFRIAHILLPVKGYSTFEGLGWEFLHRLFIWSEARFLLQSGCCHFATSISPSLNLLQLQQTLVNYCICNISCKLLHIFRRVRTGHFRRRREIECSEEQFFSLVLCSLMLANVTSTHSSSSQAQTL